MLMACVIAKVYSKDKVIFNKNNLKTLKLKYNYLNEINVMTHTRLTYMTHT